MKPSAKTKALFVQVLQDISPQEDTRKKVLPLVKEFLSQLNAQLKKQKLHAKAVLGGSYAKDTWLEGDYDVDIFVLFDLRHKNQDLSNMLHTALEAWHPIRIRGSRDYFHLKNEVLYEIIPALAIKKSQDAENTTDFSSKHVAWVQQHAANLTDDIRLFKKFCKANRVYGAESYIKGISGHVADLLIIKYKGFWKALSAIAQWKPKVIIDINKTHAINPLLVLNTNKTQGPLVVIDPVQPERNAAAAVSKETFDALVIAAKKFIQKPAKSFFEEKILNLDALAKKGELMVVSCTPLKDPQDIAGTKMLKAFEYLGQQLEEFGVRDSGWEWNGKEKALWWYVLRKNQLPVTQEIQGPPLRLSEHVVKFKKAHPDNFIKKIKGEQVVWARVKRAVTTPEKRVQLIIKEAYICNRVLSCKLCKLQPKH